MALKGRNALEWYRASPEVTPSAEIDARVLAAARASPAPVRRRLDIVFAGAVSAAAIAVFAFRIGTTPPHELASTGNGLEEGLARAWLMDLDLQKPTGPGSQEGLP